MTATAFHFLLRPDSVIVRPVAGPAMAMVDSLAAFLRPVREMDFRRVVAVAALVSFAARFWPVADLSAVVAFDLCRCPSRFATAGFVPAADPFDPAVFDFVAAAAVVDSAAVVAADLSVVAAGPGSVGSVVFAAGPGSVGSVVFAAGLASFVCSFAVALGKGRVAAVVPFCFLTHRSFF